MQQREQHVNIAAVAAAQRAYRAVQDDPMRSADAARTLRALKGGECRCGALNTGQPHSWHTPDCKRHGWES